MRAASRSAALCVLASLSAAAVGVLLPTVLTAAPAGADGHSTLTLVKDLPGGRVVGSDQFQLTISLGDTVLATGSTQGSDSGLQDEPTELAGPIVATPGETYVIGEVGVGATDLSAYLSGWRCVDRNDGDRVLTTVIGRTATITMPSAPGADVWCTILNQPLFVAPSFTVEKTVGTTSTDGVVRPGEQVTYRITVTNTGTETTQVGFVDDLSDVLDDATWTDEVFFAAVGQGVPLSWGLNGDEFSWSGSLAPGAQFIVGYSVVVDDPPGGDLTMTNVVVPFEPWGSCVGPDRCTTTTLVLPDDPGIPLVAPGAALVALVGSGCVAAWRRRGRVGAG